MEILNYDEQSPGGNIVAVFSVRLPPAGITFHKIKVIRAKNGKMFVAMPSFMVEEMGQKKFFPYVEMTKERKEDFEKKVLEAIQPFLR